MLQCAFVSRRRRLSVTLCIVAKWCVIEQKLLLTAYLKSETIWYKRNAIGLCLEVVVRLTMTTIASNSPLNILETVRDRDLVPKDLQ